MSVDVESRLRDYGSTLDAAAARDDQVRSLARGAVIGFDVRRDRRGWIAVAAASVALVAAGTWVLTQRHEPNSYESPATATTVPAAPPTHFLPAYLPEGATLTEVVAQGSNPGRLDDFGATDFIVAHRSPAGVLTKAVLGWVTSPRFPQRNDKPGDLTGVSGPDVVYESIEIAGITGELAIVESSRMQLAFPVGDRVVSMTTRFVTDHEATRRVLVQIGEVFDVPVDAETIALARALPEGYELLAMDLAVGHPVDWFRWHLQYKQADGREFGIVAVRPRLGDEYRFIGREQRPVVVRGRAGWLSVDEFGDGADGAPQFARTLIWNEQDGFQILIQAREMSEAEMVRIAESLRPATQAEVAALQTELGSGGPASTVRVVATSAPATTVEPPANTSRQGPATTQALPR